MRKVTGKYLENQRSFIGKKFGYLTAIDYLGHNNNKHAVFLWNCVCGNAIESPISDVRNGSPKSCGCQRGKYKSKNRNLYMVWFQLRSRCKDKNNKDYKYYGGRGINVCSEWESFDDFSEWAIKNGYSTGLTIDRINNDRGYSPDNCRWVAMSVQANNKRARKDAKIITANGKSKTIKDWARELGGSPSLIYDRINKQGWNEVDAVTVKPKSVRKVVRKSESQY